MEQGTLSIQKTSKGFAASIEFERDGQTKKLPLMQWRPQNDQLHGKPCKFERDKGVLVRLELEDGTVLHPDVAAQQKKQQQQPVSTASQHRPHGGGGNQQSGQRQSTPREPDDIFDLRVTRLPRDTRELLLSDIDNFHLKLNRAAYYEEFARDRDGNMSSLPPEKKKFLIAITQPRVGFTHKIKANFGTMPQNLLGYADRQKQNAVAICNGNAANVVAVTMHPAWRMALGLGHESVYETSMTLHHVFGIPFIPASSVKGVLRSYVLMHCFESDEKKAIQDAGFCQIFGSPDELEKVKSFDGKAHRGKAIFFDAFPINTPTVEPDIMNPHFGDYYGSKLASVKAPVDTMNPVPIHFLTVKGCTFQFLAGSTVADEQIAAGKLAGKSIGSFLQTNLPMALRTHGIGAKTAVGYGKMKTNQNA